MNDPRYEFYRFKDLQAAGIVTSRFDLHDKIARHGFPRPLKTGADQRAAAFWRKSTVHAWLDRRYPENRQQQNSAESSAGT